MKAFRIIAIVLLVAWMFAIFCFSAQTAPESSNTSGRIISAVVRFFYAEFDDMTKAEQQAFIQPFQFIVRKGAHFSIYAVLGVLAFASVITYNSLWFGTRFILSVLICVLYSVSDEIHQYYVPGRSCEIRDILIDTSGALFAVLFMSLITKSRMFYKYVYGGEYMSKKDLLKLYEQTHEKVSELTEKLENALTENAILNSKIDELESAKIEVEDIIHNSKEDHYDTVAEKVIDNRIKMSEEKELGAQSIGRIIISSSNCCDKLAKMGDGKDIKELINLVLGRTEVAKAEIFNIVSSILSFEEMEIKIKDIEADVADYFVSVLDQIDGHIIEY